MQSQEIRYKKIIRKVRVVSVEDRSYVLLSEIRDTFQRPFTRFTRNGEPLGVALDEKLRPMEPLRIEVTSINDIIDCEKDEISKYDNKARDKEQEELLGEVKKLQDRLANMDVMAQKILGNTELLIEKANAILRQAFELAEYTVPRLFIILPDNKTAWNPVSWWAHSYRLFFICECETERHFAFHKGYKIKQPRSFFRKYGSYLKNMLTVVRVAIAVSSFAMPQIGTLGGCIDQLPAVLFEKRSQEVLSTSLKKMAIVVDKALSENLSPETISDTHGNDMAEGVELREMASFLQMTDERGTFGNLYRSTNERGEVRWLCFYHYRQFSSEKRLENLRQDFRQLGGELRLGTAIIGESCVRKLDEMLDVLCRGLSIFKMILTNCKIRMTTFDRLLLISTQRNLIHHIEFHDVVISSTVGYPKLHSEIIMKLEEAINRSNSLTIQYIVSTMKDIVEKKISLSSYFVMHSGPRLSLELHTNDMLEQFSCSGLSDSDLGSVREWIRNNKSPWNIRADEGNRAVFIHSSEGMKESLLNLTNFLFKFSNLRELKYYHAAVGNHVLQSLCEILANSTTVLEALHFSESNIIQRLSAVKYFVSIFASKEASPNKIDDVCTSPIAAMLKGNKSLTEISLPSITGLQSSDILTIAETIGTHPRLSTVKIGSLPRASASHVRSVFDHLLKNSMIEDFTCTVDGDEEFYELRDALAKNKTLKRLSIVVVNLHRTEINDGFSQNIARLSTLETFHLSFSATINCSRLLQFLAANSFLQNLSLTRVSNWQQLTNLINNGWKLRSLSLSHCNLQFADVELFVHSLKSNPQSIVELNLSNNNLSDDSAMKLGSLLLTDTFPLTILGLSNNPLSLSCIVNLIKMLHFNTVLKILDIRACLKRDDQKKSMSTSELSQLKKALTNLTNANELVEVQWND